MLTYRNLQQRNIVVPFFNLLETTPMHRPRNAGTCTLPSMVIHPMVKRLPYPNLYGKKQTINIKHKFTKLKNIIEKQVKIKNDNTIKAQMNPLSVYFNPDLILLDRLSNAVSNWE